MSVIGIDFGNESCKVVVGRGGGFATIASEDSLKTIPSCVAFSDQNPKIGVDAANQTVTNMENTVFGFKRFLGRKFNDPYIQQELQFLPYALVPNQDGSFGIKVHYMKEELVFTPEQITTMLFTKLKEIAESDLKNVVNDCVISVPSFCTQAERKALLNAAHTANLNVLRLLNETTSTALAYGIYQQDLPNAGENPRNVVFVDCGHSSLQVFAAAFNKGKLKIIASAWDANLGGRDFDRILAQHFSNEFVRKHKIDPRNDARAFLRLTTEIEKLKKQMSTNSTKLPLSIECFMEDKDIHSELERSEMEGLCSGLITRVEGTVTKCLKDSKLSLDDIYAVEIVGGSTRIPAIKNLIEKIFKKSPSFTINQDETVARGCALECAALSSVISVREFSVIDIQNFPVVLRWDPAPGDQRGEVQIFSANDPVPSLKLLTFDRREPFCIHAFYSNLTSYPDPYIGLFTIKDVHPTPENESAEVKIEVEINIHGILTVQGATLTEKLTQAKIDVANKEANKEAMEAGSSYGLAQVTVSKIEFGAEEDRTSEAGVSQHSKRRKIDPKLKLGGTLGASSSSILDELDAYVTSGGNNLRKFLSEKVTTPPAPVEMFNFNEKITKEEILRNLFRQRKEFFPKIPRLLNAFFKISFENDNAKILLQILIHVSKIDLTEPDFNRILASFFTSGINSELSTVRTASESEAKEIKSFLKYPVSLLAFQNNFNFVFAETVKKEYLVNLIDRMNIYIAEYCFCLPGLRGTCLLDGIIIFQHEIAKDEDYESVREADLATLCLHEGMHFMLRCHAKDFNMSSPFKNSNMVRKDPAYPESNLEMGRKVEYDLFDGIRPEWITSESRASIEFMKRLKNPKTELPVMTKDDHGKFGLIAIKVASSSMACDYVPRPKFC